MPQTPKVIVASSVRRTRETAAVIHATLPEAKLGLADTLTVVLVCLGNGIRYFVTNALGVDVWVRKSAPWRLMRS